MANVLVLALCYLIGSISGSFFLGKLKNGMDIRNHGSGNAGTTNAIRVMGLKFGLATFFVDFLKGVLTATLLKNFWPALLLPGILFCILGHDFPFYMNFKGGKGVATTAGAFLVAEPHLALISIAAWLLMILFTRMVSVGSLIFFVVLGGTWALRGASGFGYVLIIGILGIYQHRSNISRILKGEESKIGGKK